MQFYCKPNINQSLIKEFLGPVLSPLTDGHGGRWLAGGWWPGGSGENQMERRPWPVPPHSQGAQAEIQRNESRLEKRTNPTEPQWGAAAAAAAAAFVQVIRQAVEINVHMTANVLSSATFVFQTNLTVGADEWNGKFKDAWRCLWFVCSEQWWHAASVCSVMSDVTSVTQYWGWRSKTVLVMLCFSVEVYFLPTALNFATGGCTCDINKTCSMFV